MVGLWTINSLFLGRGCRVDYLAHVQGQAQRSLPPGFSLTSLLEALVCPVKEAWGWLPHHHSSHSDRLETCADQGAGG